MGWKKKEERASFKKSISAATQKEEGEKKQPEKTRSWRGRGKSVRTFFHVRHFSDVPCGIVGSKSILLKKEK